MFESPEEEIEQITRQVINGLEESGASVKLYDPSDIYDWLVPWFNPRPEGEDSGVSLIRLAHGHQPLLITVFALQRQYSDYLKAALFVPPRSLFQILRLRTNSMKCLTMRWAMMSGLKKPKSK